MSSIFDYFFPPKCCACDCVGWHLCEYCRHDLADRLIDGPVDLLKDPYTGKKLLTLTSCKPSPLLRRVLHAFKYTYTEELLDVLGKLLVARLKQFKLSPKLQIVPVPLHTSRIRERGFNQSYLLAKYISKCTDFKVANILERTRGTFPQAQLSRSDRVKNVQGAFALKKPDMRAPQGILLLDDVITTGSTTSECQRVLYGAGAKLIVNVALTHGL